MTFLASFVAVVVGELAGVGVVLEATPMEVGEAAALFGGVDVTAALLAVGV